MAGAGFTPAEIDAMPMADVAALLARWRTYPPTDELLAAVFGIKPAARPNSDDPSNIGALVARHPDGKVTR